MSVTKSQIYKQYIYLFIFMMNNLCLKYTNDKYIDDGDNDVDDDMKKKMMVVM